MELARYLSKDGIITKIEAYKITKKLNEQIYRGRLYCEYENCNAELVYNERQKGKFKRYFSTLKGSKHIEECKNKIIHNGIKVPKYYSGGEDVNLSDNHIKKSLDEAYKNFFEKIYQSEEESEGKKEQKIKKQPIAKVDKTKTNSVPKGGKPITTGEGKNVIKGKEPYIYKREVSEIEEKDKGYTREVHSLVENIRLYKDEVFIDLVGLDGSKFSVYMGVPFKSNCSQEFSLLHNFKIYIEKKKREENLIICTSIGEITKVNGFDVVQVYNYKNVRLDNLNIIQLINNQR